MSEKLIAFGGAIKAIGSEGRIGGYLVMWGNAAQRDLQGEYFTPDTDLGDDWYGGSRPLLYHHGLDRTVGVRRIGHIDTMTRDDTGLWIEAQIDMRDEYERAIYELAKHGKLGFSSGTVPHWYRTADDGRITFWPIVEGSATPTPAEPRIRVQTLKSLADLPDLEGLTTKAEPAAAPAPSDTAPQGSAPPGESPDPELDTAHPSELPVSGVPTPTLQDATHAVVADESDEQSDHEEVRDMDPREIARMAIQAALSAAGVDASDDQINQLIDSVMASLEQSEDAMRQTDPAQAAAVGDAIGQAAIRTVNSMMAQQTASRAAQAQVEAVRASLRPQPQTPTGFQAPHGATDIQVVSKYASMTAGDMAFMWSLLDQHHKRGWRPSQSFARELADKFETEVKSGGHKFLHAAGPDVEPDAVKAVRFIRQHDGIKDNEVMGTAQDGAGLDWVFDMASNQIWERARNERPIASLFQIIDMPSNPYNVPLEGADPTVYRVAETTNDAQLSLAASPVPASQVVTPDYKVLTAAKIGARVPISSELEEDSIIPVIPQVRNQMQEAMLDAIEYLILHGDPSTSTGNINRYDANLATSDTYFWMVGPEGIAHLPLVSATGQLLSYAGAKPDLKLFRELRKKLPVHYLDKLAQLVFITDPVTGVELTNIDQVQTLDKFGNNATILTGQLAAIDNIPIVQSAQLPLRTSTGKVHSTTGNDYGSVMLAYRPAFRFGYRRRITSEMERIPSSDASYLVSFARIAFARRDDVCASMAHYISV